MTTIKSIDLSIEECIAVTTRQGIRLGNAEKKKKRENNLLAARRSMNQRLTKLSGCDKNLVLI